MVTVIDEMSHCTVKFTVKQIPFYYILIRKCIVNTVTHGVIYASDARAVACFMRGCYVGKQYSKSTREVMNL